MIRESHNAVVTRNEMWSGTCASEPYEVGWASEAIVFVRSLAALGPVGDAVARVQISADGIHWVDEGTLFPLPWRQDEVTFAKVREFGSWLRIEADVPEGASIKVLVTLSMKA